MGAWRIGEGTLLGLALLGGTPGAYAGRRAFRHKTRRVSFTRRLNETAGLQGLLLALAALGVAQWDGEEAMPLPAAPLAQEVAALVEMPDPPASDREGVTRVAASAAGGRLIGCKAVRAAGRAPLRRGDPDYHPKLDADSDGIACEPLNKNGAG